MKIKLGHSKFLVLFIVFLFLNGACEIKKSDSQATAANATQLQRSTTGGLLLEGAPVSEIKPSLFFTYNNYGFSTDSNNYTLLETMQDHEEFFKAGFTKNTFKEYIPATLSALKNKGVNRIEITSKGLVVDSSNHAAITNAKKCYSFAIDLTKNGFFLSEKNFDSLVKSLSDVEVDSAGSICLDDSSQISSVDNKSDLVKDFNFSAKDNFFSYLSNNGFDPSPLMVFSIESAGQLGLAPRVTGEVVDDLARFRDPVPVRDLVFDMRVLARPTDAAAAVPLATRVYAPVKQTPRWDDFFIPDRPVAEGSFGAVYILTHRVTGKKYAVKAPKVQNAAAMAEARAEVALHKGVISQIDRLGLKDKDGKFVGGRQFIIPAEEIDGMRPEFLAMPVAMTIEEAVRAGKITWQQFMQQGTEAVSALRKAGYYHNDVKTANFLYDTTDGRVKLSDLGASLPLSAKSKRASNGPPYASPDPYDPQGIDWDTLGADERGLAVSALEVFNLQHGRPKFDPINCGVVPECKAINSMITPCKTCRPDIRDVDAFLSPKPKISLPEPKPPSPLYTVRPQKVYQPAEVPILSPVDQFVQGGHTYFVYRTSGGKVFSFDRDGSLLQLFSDGFWPVRYIM